MGKKLLIVESPAKAKTIGHYLGGEFVVKSSVGHIRDLPKESNAIKIEPDGDRKWKFVPTYVISDGKTKVVNELKAAVKDADEIYLASDPDREGEAIAWHLHEVLAPVAGKKPFHRVTYNEITKTAVRKAIDNPREVDMRTVDAQQARRILDRIVGYQVSPLLWRNISCPNNRTLSAGRVQSVALRLLVERQREIDAFKPEVYFLMGVEARKREGAKESFPAKLARLDGAKPEIRDRQTADNLLLDLADSELEVTGLKTQPKTRHPLPPFTTSTLQQAASSVLGMSPGRTMSIAQKLYEHGFVTYMRTDSVNVSDQARDAAKAFVEKYLGANYYPPKPNLYKSKETAQGAHEAIRPTDIELSPKRAAGKLEPQELKLYDLIWRRFLASQMAEAKTTLRTATIAARKPGMAHEFVFAASATDIDFDGFLKIMNLSLKKKKADGEEDEDSDEVNALPPLKEGERLDPVKWIADEKKTKGPTHYSEASLIKALEDNGVGRPSTYAATIETLKTRDYAKTEKKKLVPQERGLLVCDWLVGNLDPLFNVGYTAEMEAELDKVESDGEPMDQMLSEFYAKFRDLIDPIREPQVDQGQFKLLFELLGGVKAWKPAKQVGKRIYDDQAFVGSVRKQMDEGKALSIRQRDALVKMALMYRDQIADCEKQLAGVGLFTAGSFREEGEVDDETVRFCFRTIPRIPALTKNRFLKSVRSQFDAQERPLSYKQFKVLVRAVAENCGALEDADEIRVRLAKYADGKTERPAENPEIERILGLFKTVTEWRPVVKRGKRTYDDQAFVESLKDQYLRKGQLSDRQMSALKRVLAAYRAQIPDYEKVAEECGLKGGEDDGKSDE